MREISGPHKIIANQEVVFNKLSDFRNFEQYSDEIKKDYPQLTIIDSNTCELSVPMAGNLRFFIKERTPYSRLVISSAESPLPFSIELTLLIEAVNENECNLTIDTNADLPKIIEVTAKPAIKKGLDRISKALAQLSFKK